MLKSLKWEENQVLSVKVGDNLFTLAQMRINYLMEFFDVFRSNENWGEVDLNKEKIIFCIFVSTKNLKGIFSGQMSSDVVVNSRPIRRRMLSPVFGASGNNGANLIDLADGYTNIGAETVQSSLTIDKDLQLIYDYESCGMAGSPERVLNRLKVYYETGVNWDETKVFLFSDIKPPQPSR
ncbi:hypothetical protein AWM79_13665 [Pseudomonas agarici]|uniref:Uncharacterized protein n=1 Tax=Pseudomonas agarici TaxID=46677 RepID=A0A0X1T2K9_PSEAA|nr:hypothetical protein [Pseudomonas agarici]AMB86293.1 hypothetical protein AWM79_13665 [Pseudomonas agarici]NWB90332.1 hypothetical protein [Pseudomonas agarici]NWC08769.1 hypothetical protein [Pseudomonas agarici]SEK57159.1 hypothetical protein SAMN05216604_10496 [Pseudomonas agarici]